MEPNSTVLLVLLFVISGGLLYVLVRFTHLAVRIVAAVVAVVFAAVGGMAVVNDYYGYYQTWTQLRSDFTGDYAPFTTSAIGGGRGKPALHGKVDTVTFAGAHSGISRTGYVYLPPQYFQSRYAHLRFPVVELLHGSPSYAASWLVHLHADEVADHLISEHLMGPMVLVMPQTYSGNAYSECLNSSRGKDGTYLTEDVRHDVETHFRVARSPALWGLAGVSSGGYCAANMSLHHPGMWSAVGLLSGYFRPQDGPAARVLHDNPAAEAANDPLLAARRLTSRSSPLPSFWLSAGTGEASDIASAKAFAKALHGVEKVTLYREKGGGHNFYAFGPAFDRVLPWMWTQLAPPALRVRFPIAGPVTTHAVHVRVTEHVAGSPSRSRPHSHSHAHSR